MLDRSDNLREGSVLVDGRNGLSRSVSNALPLLHIDICPAHQSDSNIVLSPRVGPADLRMLTADAPTGWIPLSNPQDDVIELKESISPWNR